MKPDEAPAGSPFRLGWGCFYEMVRRVPRGRVTTYGQVACLCGKPGSARQVGFALAALRGAARRVPWQRVLGRRGRDFAGVSILDPAAAAAQRRLLEREGVRFDKRGRVCLSHYGWTPRRRSR